MMRAFVRKRRFWITSTVVLFVVVISQPAFSQNVSSSNAGLAPYKRSATASKAAATADQPGKMASFFQKLRGNWFKKKDEAEKSSAKKLIRTSASTEEKTSPKKPSGSSPVAGKAIYDNEINNPENARVLQKARMLKIVKPDPGPDRSARYTSIPMGPGQKFSQMSSPPNQVTRRQSPKRRQPVQKHTAQRLQTDFEKPRSVHAESFPFESGTMQWMSAETLIPPAPKPQGSTIPETDELPGELYEEENDRRGQPIQETLDENQLRLDINEVPYVEGFSYSNQNGKISLAVRDLPISYVIGYIAEQNGLNIVANAEVIGNVTLSLNNVSFDDALASILLVNGYLWSRNNDVLLISRLSKESNSSPLAQGKHVQVFPLNYVSAAEIDKVVQGLLSPVGQSFITETSPTKKLHTREQIVIEDLPEYLVRIGQYIEQVDFPPQQVYIEAHVLQVTLQDDNRHGVDFEQLLRIGDSRLTLETTGFANPAASPAFFLGLDSTDLTATIEILKTTTDSKTLASPKVMVLNGQEARIQIGEQLGYLVTTTTQTSTLQEVNFLDLGVVLTVTPQITNNNQILMTVLPEVSTGRINPDTGLPEEDTTEVQTTIMLNDGQGMIIGGLIKEEDIDIQSKIPIAGDLWKVGRLFQKRTLTQLRTEIIIALVPKIMPCPDTCLPGHAQKLVQATAPLFQHNLRPNNRPWEADLPDACYDPRKLQVNRLPELYRNLHDDYPHPPEFYFPAVSQQSEALFGGSHKIQPIVLSRDESYYSELHCQPEYTDAQ